MNENESKMQKALRDLLNSVPLSSDQVDIIHRGLGEMTQGDKIKALETAGWFQWMSKSGLCWTWTATMVTYNTDAAYDVMTSTAAVANASKERRLKLYGWTECASLPNDPPDKRWKKGLVTWLTTDQALSVL